MLMSTSAGAALGFGALGLAAASLLVRLVRPWSPSPLTRTRAVVITLVSTALSAWVGWYFHADPARLAWWWLAVTGIGLAVIDLDCHRLPRPWVTAMATGGLTMFAMVAITTRHSEALLRALCAGVLVLVLGVVWHTAMSGHMGLGDVTLYAALAPYWGWVGWRAVATGVVAGVLLLGVIAAVLLLFRRREVNSRIAAGPSLITGGWIGVVLG